MLKALIFLMWIICIVAAIVSLFERDWIAAAFWAIVAIAAYAWETK